MHRNELQTSQTNRTRCRRFAVLETVSSRRRVTGRINRSHLVLLRRGKIFREITSPIVLRSVFQGISFEEFDPERKPGPSATRRNVRKIVKTSVRYSNETTRNILESEWPTLQPSDIVLFLFSRKRARGFYVKLIVLNRHTWTFKTLSMDVKKE